MSVKVESAGHIELDGDRTTVTFERHYAFPRSGVWEAITNPAQLAAWLDEAVVELRVGGRFEIYFDDEPMLGVVTELIDETVLGYSWHAGRTDESHVRWELSDEGDGTRVLLTHTRLSSRSAAGFAAGWHHHMELLVALLQGGREAWDDARFDQLLTEYRATLSN